MTPGLHPRGIKQGFCLSESQAFLELYNRRPWMFRSAGTFHQWLLGRRNPRPEVLRETYQIYEEMVSSGQELLAPEAIAANTVQIDQ